MNIAQQKQLELLIIVDNIAKENNLEYWIDGGTLLGAERHKGFIPWDNDIDICLLKNDYDKLIIRLEQFVEKSDSHLLFYNDNVLPYWSNYFGEIKLLADGMIPVRLDLVPVISLPQNQEILDQYKFLLDLVRYFIKGKFKYYNIRDYPSEMIKGGKKMCLSKFNSFLSQSNMGKKGDLFTYSFHDSLVYKERNYYSYEEIFPLSESEFEGIIFPSPNEKIKYLENLYGPDYMTPVSYQLQSSKEFKYTKNNLSKLQSETLLNLFLSRDYLLYKVRKTNTPLKRILYKILITLQYSLIGVFRRFPLYFFYHLRYSFYKMINVYKST